MACRPWRRSSSAHTGTITSFCVVNVPFMGTLMEIPYTSGLILLDGSDIPIMHLIQEVAVEDVALGHAGRGRVGARRRGRPDAREHQVLPTDRRARRRLRHLQGATSDARGSRRLVRAEHGPVDLRHQRGRDADAAHGRGPGRRRHREGPGRLRLLVQLRLPRRPAVLVRHVARRLRRRGRRSRSRTSRWTAPGRSTRPG